MGLYKNTNGVLTPVAGRGKAEYGASTIRTGTFTNPELNAETAVSKTITFSTPMPDANYELSFSKDKDALCYLEVISKTASGFTVSLVRPYSSSLAANYCTYTYTAFKLYTDNEYNELLGLPTEISRVEHLYDHSGSIASNSDLNNYVIPGNYSCDGAAICQTLSNKPSSLTQAFSLKVEIRGGTYDTSGKRTIFQTIYKVNNSAVNNADCPVYVRSRAYNVSTWSDWKRMISTSDITYIHQSFNGPAIAAGRTEIILDIANVPSGHKLLAVAGYELGREPAIHSYGAYIYSNNPTSRYFKVRLPLYADSAISQLNGRVDVLTCPAD